MYHYRSLRFRKARNGAFSPNGGERSAWNRSLGGVGVPSVAPDRRHVPNGALDLALNVGFRQPDIAQHAIVKLSQLFALTRNAEDLTEAQRREKAKAQGGQSGKYVRGVGFGRHSDVLWLRALNKVFRPSHDPHSGGDWAIVNVLLPSETLSSWIVICFDR